MDKEEYKILSETIVEMISNEEFADAAELADQIDWRRVKSSEMLQRISKLYKINCRYEDAKNILEMVYDRYPNNKNVIFGMCELYVEMEDMGNALKFLALFRKAAPDDTDAYILQYKIYEMNEVKLEERIELLEEYTKKEPKEEWMYQLAYLYHRAGYGKKCEEACDWLVTYFREGPFVIKALELKMLHAKLSPMQQDIYDHRNDAVVEELSEYESDVYEDYVPEFGESASEMDAEDFHVKTIDMGKFNTINLQKALAESMKEIMGEPTASYAPDPSSTDEIMQPLFTTDEINAQEKAESYQTGEYERLVTEDLEEVAEFLEENYPVQEVPGEEEAGEQTGEVFFADATGEIENFEAEEDAPRPIDSAEKTKQLDHISALSETSEIAQITELEEDEIPETIEEKKEERSLEEIIEEKKLQFTAPIDKGLLDAEIEESHHANIDMRNVEIPVGGLNSVTPYDDSLYMDNNGQISLVIPKEAPPVEKQITGQLDMNEILTEWDKLLHRKEEERKENMRDSIRRHTGKIFDDYDEATKNSLLRQIEAETAAGQKVLGRDLQFKQIEEIEEVEETVEPVFSTEIDAVDGDGVTDLDKELENALPLVEETQEDNQQEEASVDDGVEAESSEGTEIAENKEDALEEESADTIESASAAGDAITEDAASEETVAEETTAEENASEEVALKKDPLSVLTEKTLPSIWDEVNKSIAADAALASGASVAGGVVAGAGEAIVDGAVAVAENAVLGAGEAMATGAIFAGEDPSEEENAVATSEEALSEEFEELPEDYEIYDSFEEISEEEYNLGLADLESQMEEEPSIVINEEEVAPTTNTTVDTSAMKDIAAALEQDAEEVSERTIRELNDIPEEDDERELSATELDLFEEFLYSNKMKKQILDAVDQITLAPFQGNVLITGDTASTEVDLAKSLIKEIQLNDSNFVSTKVAKISGNKLNNKDILATLSQLSGGALIVEKAGVLTKDTLSSITRTLDNFSGGIIVILLDTVKGIGKLINKYPVLTTYFGVRIDIMPMSDQALIEYAKKYAYKKEFKIDEEKGVLALAQRISRLQIGEHHVTTIEVEDIVDEAIAHAKRPRFSTFIDIIGGKRYDYEDMIILREKDFE